MNPEAVIAAYMTMWGRLRTATAAAIVASWDAAQGFDDAAAAAFAAQAASLALAGQAQAVALVAALTDALLDSPGPDLNPDTLTGPALRAGATPTDVYLRAAVAARTVISKGMSPPEALAAGRARAGELATTDVSLAQRAAMDETIRLDSRIVGYRRILTGRSCMFCATASTQRYTSGDLMPLHAHCDCGVGPIIGSADPGRVINRTLLRALKREGGSKYWNDRGFVDFDEDGNFLVKAAGSEDPVRLEVAVRQHGELGPVLVDARHSFTGPSGIAA